MFPVTGNESSDLFLEGDTVPFLVVSELSGIRCQLQSISLAQTWFSGSEESSLRGVLSRAFVLS